MIDLQASPPHHILFLYLTYDDSCDLEPQPAHITTRSVLIASPPCSLGRLLSSSLVSVPSASASLGHSPLRGASFRGRAGTRPAEGGDCRPDAPKRLHEHPQKPLGIGKRPHALHGSGFGPSTTRRRCLGVGGSGRCTVWFRRFGGSRLSSNNGRFISRSSCRREWWSGLRRRLPCPGRSRG